MRALEKFWKGSIANCPSELVMIGDEKSCIYSKHVILLYIAHDTQVFSVAEENILK